MAVGAPESNCGVTTPNFRCPQYAVELSPLRERVLLAGSACDRVPCSNKLDEDGFFSSTASTDGSSGSTSASSRDNGLNASNSTSQSKNSTESLEMARQSRACSAGPT